MTTNNVPDSEDEAIKAILDEYLDYDYENNMLEELKQLLIDARVDEIKSIKAEAYTGIGTVRQMERRLEELQAAKEEL